MMDFPAPWWVAGGWAIDLFLGRVTRSHQDVDIAILRRDQMAVQQHLAGWSLQWVDPRSGGQFRRWQPGEHLAWPVHEFHGTRTDGATIELLLNEAVDQVWHFRRDRRIKRPLSRVGLTAAGGFLSSRLKLSCSTKHKKIECWTKRTSPTCNMRSTLNSVAGWLRRFKTLTSFIRGRWSHRPNANAWHHAAMTEKHTRINEQLIAVFNRTASSYDQIVPFFAAFGEQLAAWAGLVAGETVLERGMGAEPSSIRRSSESARPAVSRPSTSRPICSPSQQPTFDRGTFRM